MMFGDMHQLPPIPASKALFIPPSAKSTITANEMLNMFWGKSVDALNFYKELEIQQRTADPWYRCFLTECRAGNLSDEMYNYLMGLPTRHCGSWLPGDVSDGLNDDPFLLRCYDSHCPRLPKFGPPTPKKDGAGQRSSTSTQNVKCANGNARSDQGSSLPTIHAFCRSLF